MTDKPTRRVRAGKPPSDDLPIIFAPGFEDDDRPPTLIDILLDLALFAAILTILAFVFAIWVFYR